MALHKPGRRWPVWLSIWVFSLAMLAPVVSRALTTGDAARAAWTEVCSGGGSRWVNTAADGGGPEDSAPAPTVLLDACALCVLSANGLAPPAGDTVPCFLALVHLPAPTLLPAAEPPARPLLTARPRGPPSRLALPIA